MLYSDELDKFLEVNRRNSVPMTAEEQNEVILASHRRKPVKPEHEGYVHLAGMVLLFGVLIFATFNDIMRIIQK